VSAAARVPEAKLSPRGARRLASRHPWIFKDDVASASAEHGDVVRLRDPAGRARGFAFWSARSKIALRIVTLEDAFPDAAFWSARIERALDRRRALGWDAYRAVFGESDGIPGLVADVYGPHLVVQISTAATERIAGALIAEIRDRIGAATVLARNDASVRRLEGLPREVVPIDGTTPAQIVVQEDGVRFAVDPWYGQKTGAFLDQRENRLAAAALARGRVLDAFAYQGAFGLHAALAADEVVAVDASKDALNRARADAALNGRDNMAFVEANAFDDLRERERRGERFDLVMLDPPAFAKNRGEVQAARRGYKDINLRGMRLLAPGGFLITSSCSYNVDEAEFEALVREAAADAPRDLIVVARRGQASDHPVRLAFPESRYLKCLVVRDAGAVP
jgi:23S rRNA (cytosine1962-C5)-methyltransferase